MISLASDEHDLLISIDHAISSGIDSQTSFIVQSLLVFSNQPFLLNKYLSKWISSLSIRLFDSICEDCTPVCTVFYTLCTVRGLKDCIAYLPNTIEDLEFVLRHSHVLSNDDWKVRYTLWAWLSLLCRLPFTFETFLANYDEYERLTSISEKLVFERKPEEAPVIQFLASALSRQPLERAQKVFNYAVEFGHMELVYRIAKSCKITSACLSSANSTSRLSAKWRCRLFPLQWKLDNIMVSCEDLRMYLFHKDCLVREEMANSLSKITEQKQVFLKYAIENLEKVSGQSESDHVILHGSCLLLGHLLLKSFVKVDSNLSAVILKALWFDYCKGTFSIGSSVRDSACFVIWAWARRSASTISQDLLINLLALSLLDREVSVRRAAASAFQEAIGRQAPMQAGLELINLVNFFTVNQRTACQDIFCSLFPKFSQIFTQRLISYALPHHDVQVRRCCGEIVNRLKYQLTDIIPLLCEHVESADDLYCFHGAALCLSCYKISDWIEKHASSFSSRDLGSELILEALLINIHEPSISFFKLVDAGFKFKSKGTFIQQVTLNTLTRIGNHGPNELCKEYFFKLLPRADKERDPKIQAGYIMALSCIPTWIAEIRLMSYIRLCWKLLTHENVFSRVAACQSLARLFDSYHDYSMDFWQSIESSTIFSLFHDYTIDQMEGDIGSLVRMAIIPLAHSLSKKGYLDKCIFNELLIEQAVGRLDRVREVAMQYLGTSEDPFELASQSLMSSEHVLNGLIYTAGSPLESPFVERALQVLKSHLHLLKQDDIKVKRIMTRLRIR